MGLLLNIGETKGQCTAVWQVTESLQTLLKTTTLTTEEQDTLQSFKNESRQGEWLAVRTLLQHLRPTCPIIKYKENGKPYLANGSEEISISHSGQYIAIALSPTIGRAGTAHTPGVDIEHIHPKIKRIAERFLNDKEKAFLSTEDTVLVEQLCTIWCVKEVLYKIHPKGMLSFKNNLLVSPFTLANEGKLEGFIIENGTQSAYNLKYKRLGEYMLVYTE